MQKKLIICISFFSVGLLTWSFIRTHILRNNLAHCFHCNIVILSVDTLRADALPCMGYGRNTMPNLCGFASRNIFFTNAHSQSTWTLPSEVSFFTSLYPSRHLMDDPVTDVLNPSLPNLVRDYKKAGYQTVFIGNTKEFNVPVENGLHSDFDRIVDTANISLSDEVDTWQKIIDETSKQTLGKSPVFIYIYTSYAHDYLAKDFGNVTTFPLDPGFTIPTLPNITQFTRQTIDDAKRTIRYFIQKDIYSDRTLLYKEILSALDGNPSLSEAKKAFNKLPTFDQRIIYFERINSILDTANPGHMRYVRNLYDNRLKELDGRLAGFFKNFEKNHGNNTVFVLFSDHGENFGDHDVFGHAEKPLDSLTHIPLLLHVPYVGQKQESTIVELIDVYPTLLGLSGLPIPRTLSGNNLMAIPPTEAFSISELALGQIQSIRTNKWRLVALRTEPSHTWYELYDEIQDPKEDVNVADRYPDIVDELEHILISQTKIK